MRLIKRLLPRTLFGRWLLLLMAPIVILQGLLTYIFYERHWDTVTRRLALGLSGEIATIIDMRDRSGDPVALGDLLLGMQSTLQLSVTFTSNTKFPADLPPPRVRSEEHTSELQSLMRISYAVFCLKKKNKETPLKKTISQQTH